MDKDEQLAAALADCDLVSVFAGALKHTASWADLAQTVEMTPAQIADVLWRVTEQANKQAYEEYTE
jgi:hypothetical protein